MHLKLKDFWKWIIIKIFSWDYFMIYMLVQNEKFYVENKWKFCRIKNWIFQMFYSQGSI